jgi:hypothetical protein
MFSWLVDQAVLVYLLLGCGLLASVLAWWLQRRRSLALAALVCASLLLLFWLMTRLVVTDRQQLRQLFDELADAVCHQPTAVPSRLAQDFRYGSLTRAEVLRYLNEHLPHYPLREVRIRQMHFVSVSRAAKHAEVEFLAFVFLQTEEMGRPWACKAVCVYEDGAWRLARLRTFPGLGFSGQEFIP